ncbi:MAG TPA: hypothetical protein VLT36_18695 [Candidatus Dormibacteraeota bacterium]|nr:hypothetical protein [Candidatus Dormibacteraeota bacterium]
MRLTTAAFVCCLAICLGTGCNKSGSANPPPLAVNGEKVDLPSLFSLTTNKQDQALLSHAQESVRYQDYKAAKKDLQQVADSPALTEDQKAKVKQVMDQLGTATAKPQ